MPGETIEHPALGWNELPHEPGTYAWWDGHRATTIAFRANDHWEYVVDETPPRPPRPHERSRSKRLLTLVGATVGAVMLAVVVGFLIVVIASTASWQGRVRHVRQQLEASGLPCSGFTVRGPQIGSDPSYAEGTCRLDAAHDSTEVVIRAEQETSKLRPRVWCTGGLPDG